MYLDDERLWRYGKVDQGCVKAHGQVNERRLERGIVLYRHCCRLGRATFRFG